MPLYTNAMPANVYCLVNLRRCAWIGTTFKGRAPVIWPVRLIRDCHIRIPQPTNIHLPFDKPNRQPVVVPRSQIRNCMLIVCSHAYVTLVYHGDRKERSRSLQATAHCCTIFVQAHSAASPVLMVLAGAP